MSLRNIENVHVSKLWSIAENFANDTAAVGVAVRQNKEIHLGSGIFDEIEQWVNCDKDTYSLYEAKQIKGEDSLSRPRLIGRLIATAGKDEYGSNDGLSLRNAVASFIDLGNSILEVPQPDRPTEQEFFKALDQMIRGYADVITEPELAKNDEIFSPKEWGKVNRESVDRDIFKILNKLLQ